MVLVLRITGKQAKIIHGANRPNLLLFVGRSLLLPPSVFWGGEGLASLIANDLRGPANAPGFSFLGACLLGDLNRSKYYMLNRSRCHALRPGRFLPLVAEATRDRSDFRRRGSGSGTTGDSGQPELIAIMPRRIVVNREAKRRDGA